MFTRKSVVTAALAAAVLVPATAEAHVTVQPETAAAGGETRLDLRVPNERDDASTSRIELKLPDGFASASYARVPGWSVKVTTKKLATPVKTDDGEITEGVDTITWTADSEKDAIPPGAFQDFGLSAQIPDKAGEKLTFKALQTYTNGDVERWIGPDGSDTPAPSVTVTAAAGEGAGATPATPGPSATAAATTAPSSSATKHDTSGNGLAIVALILGALGLIVGAAGLFAARRSRVPA